MTVTKVGKKVEGSIDLQDVTGAKLDVELIKSVSICRPIAKITLNHNTVCVEGLKPGLTTLKFKMRDGTIIRHRIRIE